eukprot:NODE_28399_length_478_cov_1.945869.p3 GENE.NODE_28399_length_478_cov_1.945869~~NODE_28399_length_478_cov_1.945869.p3  ORF type:complete len:61 (-),score=18.75 NODE_28399_length_478_cov_1.945869:158-340(-)
MALPHNGEHTTAIEGGGITTYQGFAASSDDQVNMVDFAMLDRSGDGRITMSELQALQQLQ